MIDPMQILVITTAGQVAGNMITGMLTASAGSVRRAFQPPEKRQALDRIVNAALVDALSTLPLSKTLLSDYERIFSKFLEDEIVLDQFALLIDARQGVFLDVDLLKSRFTAAGYDPEHLPGVDFGVFVLALAESFYNHAAEEKPLQEIIKISLLRDMTVGMRDLVGHAEGILDAARDSADTNRKILELVERIASGKGESLSKEELDVLEGRLRVHYVRWFGNLSLQGMMPTPTPLVIPLKEIYVPSWGMASVPNADTLALEDRELSAGMEEAEDESTRREIERRRDAVSQRRLSNQATQRIPVTHVVSRADRRAAVVLGDPGSGKTTLMRYLTLVFSEGPETARSLLGVPDAEAGRLPIFFPLSVFDWEQSLFDQIVRFYNVSRSLPGMGPVFNRALESGNALVLFDGLDEVVEPGMRREVSKRVKAFLDEQLPLGNRAVLTSRFFGYREAPLEGDIPHFSLMDFGRGEIEQFAHKWSLAYETWIDKGVRTPETVARAQAEERRLIEQIRCSESVERLAVNPLLLSMLALLARQVIILPNRRVELYERYLAVLIEQWEKARHLGVSTEAAQRFDFRSAMDVLIPLGFWLHSEQPSNTASYDEILAQLKAIFLKKMGCDAASASHPQCSAAEKDAEVFLRDMRQFSGLLVERGQGAHGFLHLTFQEYFAGRALARMRTKQRQEFLADCLHDDHWREPILLCAGQLGVIESRGREATDFVRWILDAGSDYEEYLHRDLLLAAACSADDVNVDAPLLGEVAERLLALCSPLAVEPLFREAARYLARLQRVQSVTNRVTQGLLALLKNKDSSVRYAAADAMGPAASGPEVQTALLALLKDGSSLARYAASRALGSAAADPEVRTALLALLKDGSSLARSAAADALGPTEYDPEARTALLALLKDKDRVVRSAAAGALSSAVSDVEVRTALSALLKDKDSLVSSAAAHALGSAASDPNVRTALFAVLKEEDTYVRYSAAYALRPAASIPEVRASLLALLNEDDWPLRSAAVRALASAASDLEVRTALLPLAEDKNSDVRSTAAYALGSEAADPEVRTALFPLLKDEDSNVRFAAAYVLGSAASDPDVRTTLLALLKEEDWALGSAAIRALGPAASDPEVRTELFASLKYVNPFVRYAAADALGSAASDPNVRTSLLGLLEDEDSDVRSAAYESVMRGLQEEARCGRP